MKAHLMTTTAPAPKYAMSPGVLESIVLSKIAAAIGDALWDRAVAKIAARDARKAAPK